MKILITGGSGSLGSELNNILNINNQILSIYNLNIGNCNNYNSIKIDIRNKDKLEKVFAEFKPDVVIHTAAVSNSAKADSIPSKYVYDVNVKATENLSVLCSKFSSKLIYASTDLVYAGNRGTMLKENAKLAPVSLYAETKLMGEIKIKETSDNYLILRMALMFGIGKYYVDNHFNLMFMKLMNNERVKLFTNQYRSPISFKEAAEIISGLIKLNITNDVINLGGKEKITRFEMGRLLYEETNFNDFLLLPVKMEDVNVNYKVEDISMNTDKLRKLGFVQKSLREMIHFEISKVNL